VVAASYESANKKFCNGLVKCLRNRAPIPQPLIYVCLFITGLKVFWLIMLRLMTPGMMQINTDRCSSLENSIQSITSDLSLEYFNFWVNESDIGKKR
jgi:hypothetical protein